MAQLTNEVNGILLYRRQGDYCPIEAILTTGIGTTSHVVAEDSQMKVANEFFRKNPDYQYVKFHTHSQGTISQHGSYYETHFSDADIKSYQDQLRHYPDFIGMVVTPRTKLLYAPDNPDLRVVPGDPRQANERIRKDLKAIAKSSGVELFPVS